MSTTARTATGDIVIPRVIVTDPAQVALQTILDTFSLWQADWFLDLGAGFPWLQQVLGVKNPNVTQVRALIEKAILFAPYVINVTATVAFDTTRRAFAYRFAAKLNTGQIITGGSAAAFRVEDQPPTGVT